MFSAPRVVLYPRWIRMGARHAPLGLWGRSAMSSTSRVVVLLGTLALGACAVGPPPGPSVAALPGKDKSLEALQQDDATCRQYAAQTLGNVSPADDANHSNATHTVVGPLSC